MKSAIADFDPDLKSGTFVLAILYKLSIIIRTGMQASESPAAEFPETRSLDDTDPVYF